MPVCNRSLQDEINIQSSGLELNQAVAIIREIVAGLLEVEHIVHRDLKPSNILFHEGDWKVADFGISKFIEDATSAQTMRSALTPQYAAPEQWMGERPTSATDVYALGCIVHALMTGSPPFPFGDIDELEKAHRFTVPPALDKLPARMKVFTAQMLRKEPGVRPSLQRCALVFSALAESAQNHPGSRALFDVVKVAVEAERAAAEAKAQIEAAAQKRHDRLFAESVVDFDHIIAVIVGELGAQPQIRSSAVFARKQIVFGKAQLIFFEKTEATFLGRAGPMLPGLEIISYNQFNLTAENLAYSWNATLFYANLGVAEGFRWYEIGFKEKLPRVPLTRKETRWKDIITRLSSAMNRRRVEQDVPELEPPRKRSAPFSLRVERTGMRVFAGETAKSVEVAYGPLPVTGEDEEMFIARWLGLIGMAANGLLREPENWPPPDLGFSGSPLAKIIEDTLVASS
jgi:serine/threonine-protein kinase